MIWEEAAHTASFYTKWFVKMLLIRPPSFWSCFMVWLGIWPPLYVWFFRIGIKASYCTVSTVEVFQIGWNCNLLLKVENLRGGSFYLKVLWRGWEYGLPLYEGVLWRGWKYDLLLHVEVLWGGCKKGPTTCKGFTVKKLGIRPSTI